LETNSWDENLSQLFVDYGRYFVPERERQIEMIVELLAPVDPAATLVEICCGEGLLAQAVLERFPGCSLIGLDGSPEMLRRAQERLSAYRERFHARKFDLAASDWRKMETPLRAVLTSLALHHLDGPQKQALFRDVHQMLAPGGVFLIADLIEPAHPSGWKLAADAWDEAVRQRATTLDGNLRASEFFERERWNTYRYFDPEDIDKPTPLYDQLKWLEQAGFVQVDVFWMRAGHALFGGWCPG
jgi:tRNA (cmo5U34)-methyltransferase